MITLRDSVAASSEIPRNLHKQRRIRPTFGSYTSSTWRQISNLVLFPCPPLTKILPSHRLITTPHYNCQIASYNTRSKVVGPFCSLFHPFFLFLFFFLFWGFSTEFRILLYSSSMALSCHLSQPFRLDLRISQVVGFQSPLAIWYITLTNIYIL